MRVFEYSIKALDNQVIDQILESSNTQKNLIYSVLRSLGRRAKLIEVIFVVTG